MKKILIVEDDKFLEDLEGSKFSAKGFEALFAKSSKEVEDVLAKTIPDVILLDLVLPGVDGFEILKKIKADEKTKHVPVIVFSNLSDQKDIDRVMADGALEYIMKANYTLNEIVDKVTTVMNGATPPASQ